METTVILAILAIIIILLIIFITRKSERAMMHFYCFEGFY